MKIVRPLESIAETQPQLQPALLRLSAISFQYFSAVLQSEKLEGILNLDRFAAECDEIN